MIVSDRITEAAKKRLRTKKWGGWTCAVICIWKHPGSSSMRG